MSQSQRDARVKGRPFRTPSAILATAVVLGAAAGAYGLTQLFAREDPAGRLRPTGAFGTTSPPSAVTSPAPDATDHRSQPPPRVEAPRFESIAAATEFLQSKVDVPVVLPQPLPSDTRLGGAHSVSVLVFGHRVNGQLHLVFGSHRILDLQYGLALFDGCGTDAARPTAVGGRPALAYVSTESRWTELIWPATARHPVGRYGVAGNLSLSRALALATSRDRARVVARRAKVGC